jgi:hypothetical protein
MVKLESVLENKFEIINQRISILDTPGIDSIT